MVSEAGGENVLFSSASYPLCSSPASEQHCRSFYIIGREGMELLGGDLTNPDGVRFDFHGERILSPHEKEILHYLWKDAMGE